MPESRAGEATPCTNFQKPLLASSETWKAGHSRPRLDRSTRKMAIRALGATQATVRRAIQRLFTKRLRLRVAAVSGMLSQDDVFGLGGELDGGALRVYLAGGVGDGVGLADVGVRGKAVGHGVPPVDAETDLLDLDLQVLDPLRQVFDGVHLLALWVRGVRSISLGGRAHRAGGWEVMRVL